jgi:hypothetical protein
MKNKDSLKKKTLPHLFTSKPTKNMKTEAIKPQISIFQPLGDGQKIRVRIEDENVWLTQKLIA